MKYELKKGEVKSYRSRSGFAITCHQGRLWVTVEGYPGDIVLFEGHHYETHLPGHVVVQSLTPAAYTVRLGASRIRREQELNRALGESRVPRVAMNEIPTLRRM